MLLLANSLCTLAVDLFLNLDSILGYYWSQFVHGVLAFVKVAIHVILVQIFIEEKCILFVTSLYSVHACLLTYLVFGESAVRVVPIV